MSIRKASLSTVKHNNYLLVFRCLWDWGPLTRAELSRKTELTPSSVTYITGSLLERGLIVDRGAESVGRVGRKGLKLEVNFDRFMVLGYDVGSAWSRVRVCDGRGCSREELRFPTARGEFLMRQIEETVESLCSRFSLSAAGFAFPGYVDKKGGVVVRAHNLGLENYSLARIMAERCGFPVFVDNNVAMMARSVLDDAMQRSRSLVIVNLGPGIGAAIVEKGRIFRGHNNAAGELGHVTVNHRGALCSCGRRGCLETESSARAIVRHYRDFSGKEWPAADDDALEVFNRASGGDEAAIRVFERAGKFLGIALGHLVSLLNPERVYVAGGVAGAWEFMKARVQSSFEKNCFYASRDTKIIPSPLGENITVLGAARFAFREYIEELLEE